MGLMATLKDKMENRESIPVMAEGEGKSLTHKHFSMIKTTGLGSWKSPKVVLRDINIAISIIRSH